MGEIASPAQISRAFWKRAAITVPFVLALGLGSGRLANSSFDNAWFALLTKPEAMPPSWAFGVAWTILYVMQGLALAIILNARGNRIRGVAITLFVVQLAINLAWSPLFFALHQITAAFWLIIGMFVAALATTLAFGAIRSLAAWLMVPYLAWLGFAAALNRDYVQLNPNAEQLAPAAPLAQIGG